ncbi:SIR2 family protein [Carnobacterium sp. TMP28]|uniref:SIR2 family protein n=1 Tax=Carnobacterium sp. TMP28 TaxID=3397060 RepID=UPI0039E164A9
MLQDIIDDNSYPVVFIGSGISKRYLEDFPTWEELLKGYWGKIGEKENFYTHLRKIKANSSSNLTEEEKDFNVNSAVALYINKKFDDLFYEEVFSLAGLSIDQAYNKNISPFKYDLASKFKDYEFKESMKTEIESYKKFLSKARVIVTTNYDMLTENLLEELGAKPKIYIGQKGFFDKTLDWAELYKIHGDVNYPESIVINEKDYERYDSNSVLISAKILSTLLESPIIFLGYSLTDRNVRKLLTDFSAQLPKEDIRKSSNRIVIVEYLKNEDNLIEQMSRDEALDIGYIHISTDNYGKLYEKISQINEGLTPYEVLRYQSAIKEIVLAAGTKGSLDAVLVSPNQLDDLEEQIAAGKPIVVALGNKKYMFVYPDIVNYLKDYLFNDDEILPSIALTFAAKDGSKLTKTPFSKYLKENDVLSLNLDREIITKLNNKIENMSTIESVIYSLNDSIKSIHINNIEEIKNHSFPATKEIEVVINNIISIDKEELTEYILHDAFPKFVQSNKTKTNLRSPLRKLFFAYDLLINGNLEKIK